MKSDSLVGGKTLWMGAIQPHWDEAYLSGLFSNFKNVVSVKIIRSTPASSPVGYAFIEFDTPEDARVVKEHYHGLIIPGTSVKFRLNWRTKSPSAEDRTGAADTPSLFVGDLSSEVTSEQLFAEFSGRFSSCVNAKVIRDQVTDKSRGYGFVEFSDPKEYFKALHSMRGVVIGSRAIRTGEGKPKGQGRNSCALGPHGLPMGPYIRNTKNPYDQAYALNGVPVQQSYVGARFPPTTMPYVSARPYVNYPPAVPTMQQAWPQPAAQYMSASQYAHYVPPQTFSQSGHVYPQAVVQQAAQQQVNQHVGSPGTTEELRQPKIGPVGDLEDRGRPNRTMHPHELPSNESPEYLDAEMENQEVKMSEEYNVARANDAYLKKKANLRSTKGFHHTSTRNQQALSLSRQLGKGTSIVQDSKTA